MRPKKTSDPADQGMTLLELLIVISILSVLAVLASVQLSGYLDRARHDTARLQIKELGLALDLYELDVGRYPEDADGLRALLVAPDQASGWRGPYLKDEDAIVDPWGADFRYSAGEAGRTYTIESYGADGQPGGDGDDADISS